MGEPQRVVPAGQPGRAVLALNAGSSTLKYKLLRVDPDEVLAEGSLDHMGAESIVPAAEKAIAECRHLGIDAIGHRVVHGGHLFRDATLVTPDVVARLRTLEPLDPLHNPAQIHVIASAMRLLPGVPSVAVFDTAFHSTLPEVAALYALPWELSERLHLRRYGFHGLSHRYVSETVAGLSTERPSRLVTCHLGNGASVCAIKDGKSVDTSMGLTPLEGLVMGTRSGSVDPGLPIYLQRSEKLSADDLDTLLNTKCGLLGLSGRSADVRDLEKASDAGDTRASLALAMFAYRVREYIGAYAATLGGLDTVAFAGGIGEHSPSTRARICAGLDFLGLTLDPAANAAATGAAPARISPESRVAVWVIPTNEELEIAREVIALL